ncbi:MAG: dTMP kinase [Thiogranum sp.]|nr:dTMP kinase [Thiogranum sp.]
MRETTGKGRFITLEGGEGAGKSTNLEYLRNALERAGIELLVTREPGGTLLGEKIRGLLLDPDNTAMSDDAEMLLMFAARAQHIHQLIMPALEQGTWVICDRFTDATYAYQGGGRGVDPRRIEVLEQWAQRGFQPDLTILFDLPVEIGLQRAGARGDLDRFEREQTAFFERVRNAYLDRAKHDPARFRTVDAGQDLIQVQQQLDTIIGELLMIAGCGD